MKRDRGNLEAKTDEEEHQTEDQADTGARLRRLRDAGKVDRSGEPVDQGRAVQQHSRRQRPQHEIFQPGLSRLDVLAIGCRDDVKRQTHQLEPEIKCDQVGSRDQHQHPERRQQEERAILELLLIFDREIVER